MSVEMAIWRMDTGGTERIDWSTLDTEDRLEQLLVGDPEMLDAALLIIGQQVPTAFGGRIDLLALDDASDRIVQFLAENYGVPINAVFFRHFADGDKEYLARTWLLDPQVAESRPARRARSKRRQWNGRDYYAVLGGREDYEGGRWSLAQRYGFLNGGSGKRYWKPLQHLERGHRVFAHVAGRGYVGIGVVTGEMQHIRDATVTVEGEEVPLIKQPDIPSHFLEAAASDDEEVIEMVVPVEWTIARDLDEAFWEPGLFANQNTACKLTDQNTIDRVSAEFGLDTAS